MKNEKRELKAPKVGAITLDNPSLHNVGPKPAARLVSWTPEAANLLKQVWDHATLEDGLNIHTQQAHAYEGTHSSTMRPLLAYEEEDEFMGAFLKEWTGIPEMVQFTFQFDNIPVALLGQLARHRLLSLFVRSGRVFYDKNWGKASGHYFTPDSLSLNDRPGRVYHGLMRRICSTVNELIGLGIPIQDARGLMPMHSLYTMTVSMNLRTLIGIVQRRTCMVAQQQLWAPLLASMRDELMTKVSKSLGDVFNPPCVFAGKCVSDHEQSMRASGKIELGVCPNYMRLFGEPEETKY